MIHHPTDDDNPWMRYQPLGVRPMYPIRHRGLGIRAERRTFRQWLRGLFPLMARSR